MKESEKEMGGGGGGKKWRKLQRKWKKRGRRNFKCLPPLSPSARGTIFQNTPVVLAKPAPPVQQHGPPLQLRGVCTGGGSSVVLPLQMIGF